MISNIKDFQEEFDKYFKRLDIFKGRFEEYNKHWFSTKGKYIRPYLVFLGADKQDNNLEKIFQIGTVIELIHNYTLIHDDLKCMDNDIFRRDKKTIHVLFGEGQAVLYGSYLYNKAMQLVVGFKFDSFLMSHLTGTISKILEGQLLDINKAKKNIDEYKEINKLKTTSLIEFSYVSGCYLSKCLNPISYTYAKQLGDIFQLLNDYKQETNEGTIREYLSREMLEKELMIQKSKLIQLCKENNFSKEHEELIEYIFRDAFSKR